MTGALNRRGQRFVAKATGLRARSDRVNRDIPEGWPEQLLDHHWACPGCGSENDSRHLSCRYCETLYWGVCP